MTAQERSSKVDAHGMLQGLCQGDPSGRHVACDLLATRNWSLMEAAQQFGDALQNAADDADDADQAPAPTRRTGNHK